MERRYLFPAQLGYEYNQHLFFILNTGWYCIQFKNVKLNRFQIMENVEIICFKHMLQ